MKIWSQNIAYVINYVDPNNGSTSKRTLLSNSESLGLQRDVMPFYKIFQDLYRCQQDITKKVSTVMLKIYIHILALC